MTLQEFSRDIIPIFQALFSLFGAIGVGLLWRQIKQTNRWNKINTQHHFLTLLPSKSDEIEIWKYVRELNDDGTGKLTWGAAKEIHADSERWIQVKTYLDTFEYLAIAINNETLSEKYAYNSHAAIIIDINYVFDNYIKYMRSCCDDPLLYIELEKVALKWEAKDKACSV